MMKVTNNPIRQEVRATVQKRLIKTWLLYRGRGSPTRTVAIKGVRSSDIAVPVRSGYFDFSAIVRVDMKMMRMLGRKTSSALFERNMRVELRG